MAEDKFNLVFKGQLAKSVELAQAKANLGKLFKVDGARLEALFSGKAVTLKKNLDFENATKYRVAIKKAGAIVELVPVEVAATHSAGKSAPAEEPKRSPSGSAETVIAPNVRGKAVFGEREPTPAQSAAESKSQPVGELTAPPASQTGGTAAAQVTLVTPDYGIAPAGSDLVDEVDRASLPVMEVDISGIELKEASGLLVDPSEIERPEPVQVDVAGISLAAQEGDLVKPEERPVVEAVSVDISGLSLGPEGERLSAPKKAEPTAPDVSHIHLVD